VDDPLDGDVFGTGGKKDQVSARDGLAKAGGEIVSSSIRLRPLADPGAEVEPFVDERDGAPRIVGGDEVADRLQILDGLGA